MRWLLLLLLAGCPKGEESIRKANVYFKNGELALAESEYRAATEANPKNAAAWEGLGNIAYERKQYDQAIEHYRRAIGIEPKAITVRHKLAVALTTASRTAEAMELLEETIDLEPKDAFAHNALGGLHQKRGELERAKAMQIAALSAEPDFFAARFALGSLLVDLDELEEADREFSTLAKAGQTSLAEYGFARIAAKRQDWEAAAGHLDGVLRAAVSHPEKIAKDPVFSGGWEHPAMVRVKAALDRAAGTTTSTVPAR